VTTYAYAYANGINPTTVTATTNTRVVKTTLDGLGRTIKVETGDTTAVQSVVDTVYDSCACSPLGKVKQVSLPHAPNATVYWTTYTYDALGRTVTVTAHQLRLPGQHYHHHRSGGKMEDVHERRHGEPDPGERTRAGKRDLPVHLHL